MIKSPIKFRNKKKNSKNLNMKNNEKVHLNYSKGDNSKMCFNQTSNTLNMGIPTLSKIIKTEEDFLFKSLRKYENDEDVINIENKLEKKIEENNNDKNHFSRENYISNRDTSLPNKIIDKQYDKILFFEKNNDKNITKEEVKIETTKINNQNNKLEKKNVIEKIFGKKWLCIKLIMLIFMIIFIIVLIVLLLISEF